MSGGLFDANGQPVLRSGINFKLEVRDKTGSCVLYSETHNGEDLTTTKGQFSLLLGSGGSAQNFLAGGNQLDASVFLNRGVTGAFTGCPAGVTLASGDERVVRVYYDLGSGLTAMTPDVPIVSSAYAMVADSLQGKGATDFIQVKDDGSTAALNQANTEYAFSFTNWPKLKALIDGTSSAYLPMGGTAPFDFNNQRLIRVANPGTSPFDAANKGYVDTNMGGRTADFTGVGPAVGDGKTMVWDQAAQKWVVGNPVISGTAGGDLSGSYPNPVIAASAVTTAKVADNAITSNKINTTGVAVNRLVATDATTGSTLTYFTCGVGEIMWWTATGWQCTTVAALAPVKTVAGKTPNASGDVPLNAADISGLGTVVTKDFGSTSGQVPLLDASNHIPAYMLPAGTGTITAVNVTSPLLGGGVSGSVTISLDVGTGANQVVRLNASAQLPAVDGSLLTGVNATKIGTRTVASTAPSASQVLAFNATSSQWEPMSAAVGSVTSVVSGTGLVAGTITSSGTINVDVGTTAGKIVQFDGSARYPANDGSQITNVNATKIGTRAVSSTAPGASQVLGYNATSSQWEPMTDGGGTVVSVVSGTGLIAGTITTNGTINVDVGTGAGKIVQLNGSAAFPAIDAGNLYNVNATKIGTRAVSAAAPGGSQVLGYNASLSQWEPMSAAVGSVTSVVSGTGLVAGNITSSGTISVDVGTGANKIVQLNGSGAFAAIDGSNLYNVNASKIGTRTVASSSPSASQVLMWNGSLSQWEPANASSTLSWPLTATPGTTPATAPSYTFSNDTDTGVYSPAPGTLALTTNGTTRFNVNPNGDVSVPGNLGVTSNLLIGPSSTTLMYEGVANSFRIKLNGYDGAFDDIANNPLMTIKQSGKVGIGTTSPASILDVAATGTNSALVVPRDIQANRPAANAANGMIRYNTSTNKFEGYENGSWVNMTAAGAGSGDFKSDGSVAMTAAIRASGGNAGTPGYAFVGDTDTGVYSTTANNLGFATAGTARMMIDAAGNVGIGTTTPGMTLDVAGKIQFKDTGSVYSTSYGGSIGGLGDAYDNGWTTDTTTGQLGLAASSSLVLAATGTSPIVFTNVTGFRTGSELMRLTNSGKLGIGTPSPIAAVDVAITGTNSALVLPRDTTANRPSTNVANGMIRYNTNTNRFEAYENGSWTNMIAAGGGTTAFPLLANPGTAPVSAPSYSFNGNSSTGLYSPAANKVAIAVNGTAAMVLDSTGLNVNSRYMLNGSNALAISSSNLSVGNTLAANGTGTDNTAVGYLAGNAFSSGAQNTAVGSQALASSSSGNANTAVGWQSLYLNNGDSNSGFGHYTLRSNGSGTKNNAFGRASLYTNTTGSRNQALGYYAQFWNSVGNDNVAIGDQAMMNGTSSFNTAVGNNAGLNVTGASNTLIGYNAGANITTGSNNLVIGNGGTTASATANNQISIANLIFGDSSAGLVGIGTSSPRAGLDVAITGTNSALVVPRDTTANRPAGNVANGMLRYNTSTNKFEAYENGAWTNMIAAGGGTTAFPLLASPGTAPSSAPSYSFAGSTNTGLLSQAANTVALSTAGTSRLSIDATGKIGIGTSTPNNLLNLVGSNSSPILEIDNNSSSTAQYPGINVVNYAGATVGEPMFSLYNFRGNSATTAALVSGDSLGKLTFSGGTNTSGGYDQAVAIGGYAEQNFTPSNNGAGLAIYTTGLNSNVITERVRVSANGLVGIGTSTPGAALDLSVGGTNSALIVPRDTTANRPSTNVANGMLRYNTNTNKFEAYENGAWANMIGSGGGGSFPLLASPGTTPASAPSYSFTGSTNTGLFSQSAGTLALATSGTARLTVDASGYLGVGTSSPQARLHVLGGIRSEGFGFLALGGSDPAAPVAAPFMSAAATTGFSSSPAYSFWYQSGTGIANPAVDTLAFTTAGAERLRVDSSGRVIIGGSAATGADHYFDVWGDDSAGYLASFTDTTAMATGVGASIGLKGMDGSSDRTYATIKGGKQNSTSGNYDGYFAVMTRRYSDNSNTEKMRITAQGYMGIGTTSPASALDVYGTGAASALVVPRDTQANRPSAGVANGMIRYNTSTNKFEAYENGAWANMIGGPVALSNLAPAAAINAIDNTNYAQTWNWSSATTQNPLTLTANVLTTGSVLSVTSFNPALNSTNGLLNVAYSGTSTLGTVARVQANSTAGSGLTVLANGNVGVGTASPSDTMTVSGNVTLTGQISGGSQTITGGGTSINWNNGNAISTDYNCASAFSFANMRDGGTYTLVVTDTTTTTKCTFSTTLTGTGAGTVTYYFNPGNTTRTGSSHTVYTLMRVGSAVYVSWSSGFQ